MGEPALQHLPQYTSRTTAKMAAQLLKILAISILGVCFLTPDVSAGTAEEQMKSWYDFLSNIGNGFTIQNPEQVTEAPVQQVREEPAIYNPPTNFHDEYPQQEQAYSADSYCKKETAPRLKQYCQGLHDGDYFDPWNPYCGYIRCIGQVPMRMICGRGTWMGTDIGANKGQAFMCRRGLAELKLQIYAENKCPLKTDLLLLCENAGKVAGMNDQM